MQIMKYMYKRKYANGVPYNSAFSEETLFKKLSFPRVFQIFHS